MKIITKAEATQQSTHSVLLYGDPGVGKTSFACSTPNPLLLPFDQGGALRAVSNADMVQLASWQDAKDFVAQPVGTYVNYDTVVVDTVGKLLDSVAEYVIAQNPAVNQQRGSSALSMKGYGAMKSEFQQWFKQVQAHDLNLVLIAHAKESDELTRPDIVGGSQTIVLQEVDAVAMLTIVNGERTAMFNPSARYYGKDCAGLGNYQIAELPTISFDDAGTMWHVLSSIRAAIQRNIEAIKVSKKAYLEMIEAIRVNVATSETVVGALNWVLTILDESQERKLSATETAMQTKESSFQLAKKFEGATLDEEAANYCLQAILDQPLLATYKDLKAALNKAAEASGLKYNADKKEFENV